MLNTLNRAGTLAATVDQLLQIGQVAAWTAGYPEYRTAAVKLAQSLPLEISRSILQIPASLSDADVLDLLGRCLVDPWAYRFEMSMSPQLSFALVVVVPSEDLVESFWNRRESSCRSDN